MSALHGHRAATRGNRLRATIWGGAALLLLLPLVAMQFTHEVNWTGLDFVVFGSMLLAACGSYELMARMSGSRAYRAGAAVAIGTAFLLVWINLAVGIIGTEHNPANRMFAGVLAVLLTGSAIARLRSQAMFRTLITTALAQVLVSVIALLMGLDHPLLLTGIFTALWLVSAWLFARSAKVPASPSNLPGL